MATNTRQTGSVRDLREGPITFDAPEVPVAPAWLNKAAKKEFKNLVTGLISAQVPLKSVDASAISMAANCIANIAAWTEAETKAETLKEKIDCGKLIAKYQQESQTWLNHILATPLSRARVGLKSDMKKDGPLATLLKQKQQNAA